MIYMGHMFLIAEINLANLDDHSPYTMLLYRNIVKRIGDLDDAWGIHHSSHGSCTGRVY